MYTHPEVWRGEDGVELPALLDHQGEGADVLHDLEGDLAAVGDARALLLVAEQDHVVHLHQAVQLPVMTWEAIQLTFCTFLGPMGPIFEHFLDLPVESDDGRW